MSLGDLRWPRLRHEGGIVLKLTFTCRKQPLQVGCLEPWNVKRNSEQTWQRAQEDGAQEDVAEDSVLASWEWLAC